MEIQELIELHNLGVTSRATSGATSGVAQEREGSSRAKVAQIAQDHLLGRASTLRQRSVQTSTIKLNY